MSANTLLNTFELRFRTTDTLPCIARGLADAKLSAGRAYPHLLDPVAWGALVVAGMVNGCGPEGYGALVPDYTPRMRAAGHRHDLRYLIGGAKADRAEADAEFARHAPELYAEAVKLWGAKWFAMRDHPLSHGEMLVVVQAAYWKVGYAAASAMMPSLQVMRWLEVEG